MYQVEILEIETSKVVKTFSCFSKLRALSTEYLESRKVDPDKFYTSIKKVLK